MKTAEEVTLFNPWRDAQAPGRIRPEPERSPDQWYLLSEPAAGAIGGAAQLVVLEHPDRTLADQAWLAHRVRERLVAWQEAGETAARVALAELQGSRLNNSQLQLLQATVVKFLEARGVIAWEQAERARHDARAKELERRFAKHGGTS